MTDNKKKGTRNQKRSQSVHVELGETLHVMLSWVSDNGVSEFVFPFSTTIFLSDRYFVSTDIRLTLSVSPRQAYSPIPTDDNKSFFSRHSQVQTLQTRAPSCRVVVFRGRGRGAERGDTNTERRRER
ncbi:hypothetical protein E2542_SST15765 [Spatholobus suberectus]|nr:hypothetical protein E2542_SST15765 [Spatholobus suberectus]